MGILQIQFEHQPRQWFIITINSSSTWWYSLRWPRSGCGNPGENTSRYSFLVISIPFLLVASALAGGNNYKSFDVASYARVMDVQEMKDPAWLERSWAAVTKCVKFDKIYLDTQGAGDHAVAHRRHGSRCRCRRRRSTSVGSPDLVSTSANPCARSPGNRDWRRGRARYSTKWINSSAKLVSPSA